MNDLGAQYLRYKDEIDRAIQNVIDSGQFIKGPIVNQFEADLSKYLGGVEVITCGNGTDALQIALMALDLKEGDEVITTPFTFAATAEVIALLKLKPVFVDIKPDTYCIDPTKIEEAITPATRCIIPVHLFGTIADMNAIMAIADLYGLYVIEDAAQSLGSLYKMNDGNTVHSGTIGHIGTTSFFPSKNLGCFGDGGALFTKDRALAEKIRMIANHGTKVKYNHEIIGVNSRLDSIQAAILNVKLQYLDMDISARIKAAAIYDQLLHGHGEITSPIATENATHSYHQYTVRVKNRSKVRVRLGEAGISSMIYYPIPLHIQKAFAFAGGAIGRFPVTECACDEVLSLPIYPDITKEKIEKVVAHL